MSFYSKRPRDASSFRIFSDSMLQDSTLPLSELVEDEVFEEAFDLFGVDFASDEDAVYTPALVLWALVSQALFKGEQRSCNAAVTRIAAWWAAQGRVVNDTNSGAYCRARHKIPDELVAHLTRTIAERAERSSDLTEALDDEQAVETLTPRAIAEVKTQAVSGRVLMVDGFTVDAADTPENQEEYPQNPSQEDGLGFPILRCVSLTQKRCRTPFLSPFLLGDGAEFGVDNDAVFQANGVVGLFRDRVVVGHHGDGQPVISIELT
jgi:hypothetical protein